MARLSKKKLLAIVERAIHESGWSFLCLPPAGSHPATFQIYRENESHRVRVYIWNLTPGGKNRPVDEWRIQVTGVRHFEAEPAGKTLILGWEASYGVFAGFDLGRHRGEIGSSASIQLRESALRQAGINGFASHNKGNSELAIAFRPDFLASYIDNLDSLHACGQIEGEIDILNRIGEDPQDVDEEEVEREIAEPRRYAVVSTRRALREIDFRKRVLTAYSQRCSMCGIQLRLIDGSHILPVAHPDSTDQTSNGVALCSLHHRAFDRAFVTFDPEFRIHVNGRMARDLRATDHAGGLESFRDDLRPILALPPDRRDRPDIRFVEAANALRCWVF